MWLGLVRFSIAWIAFGPCFLENSCGEMAEARPTAVVATAKQEDSENFILVGQSTEPCRKSQK